MREDFAESDSMLMFWIGGAVGTLAATIRAEVSLRYVAAMRDGFMLRAADRAGNVVKPLSAAELRLAAKRGGP